MFAKFRWLIISLCLVSLTACGAKATSKPKSKPLAATPVVSTPVALTSVYVDTAIPSPPQAVAAATAAATAASTTTAVSGSSSTGGKVPGSCDDLVKLVGSYIGGVATTKSLGAAGQFSCEYANTAATTIVVVNIGAGTTPAALDQLRTTSGQGGRTVTPINGLGASAFSVSKGDKTAGVSVLTAQGMLYVVESNLSLDQDVALIQQLMAL